jgi:hypothetical protein
VRRLAGSLAALTSSPCCHSPEAGCSATPTPATGAVQGGAPVEGPGEIAEVEFAVYPRPALFDFIEQTGPGYLASVDPRAAHRSPSSTRRGCAWRPNRPDRATLRCPRDGRGGAPGAPTPCGRFGVTWPEDRLARVTWPEDRLARVTWPEDRRARVTWPEDRRARVTWPEDRRARVTWPGDRLARVSAALSSPSPASLTRERAAHRLLVPSAVLPSLAGRRLPVPGGRAPSCK